LIDICIVSAFPADVVAAVEATVATTKESVATGVVATAPLLPS